MMRTHPIIPALWEGVRASAALFILMETAKANELEPYRYIGYLFERLPKRLYMKSEKDREDNHS